MKVFVVTHNTSVVGVYYKKEDADRMKEKLEKEPAWDVHRWIWVHEEFVV